MPPYRPSFDYYSELGIASSASPEVLKTAFRCLALTNHPDKNPGTDTTTKMKRINEAYDTLKDSQKRSDYDYFRSRPAPDKPHSVRSNPTDMGWRSSRQQNCYNYYEPFSGFYTCSCRFDGECRENPTAEKYPCFAWESAFRPQYPWKGAGEEPSQEERLKWLRNDRKSWVQNWTSYQEGPGKEIQDLQTKLDNLHKDLKDMEYISDKGPLFPGCPSSYAQACKNKLHFKQLEIQEAKKELWIKWQALRYTWNEFQKRNDLQKPVIDELKKSVRAREDGEQAARKVKAREVIETKLSWEEEDDILTFRHSINEYLNKLVQKYEENIHELEKHRQTILKGLSWKQREPLLQRAIREKEVLKAEAKEDLRRSHTQWKARSERVRSIRKKKRWEAFEREWVAVEEKYERTRKEEDRVDQELDSDMNWLHGRRPYDMRGRRR